MTVYEFLEKMGYAWDFYINHNGKVVNESKKVSFDDVKHQWYDDRAVIQTLDLNCISVNFEESTIYC